MFNAVIEKIVWPLLGVGVVVLGCFVIAFHNEHQSPYPYLLIALGLVMVSFEKARTVADFAVAAWNQLRHPGPTPRPHNVTDSQVLSQGVLCETEAPPAADEWNRFLRPVLYQASHYATPTYYLNMKLQILDWNVAFELLFHAILGKIRNRHVNYFINELENKTDVFDHARDFSERVRKGFLAMADTEPLVWRSEKYGLVTFLKVAVLLSDARGEPQGWSVALLPSNIDWKPFGDDLFAKVREDKLWSLYASSYDRVLLQFPPYLKLIEDVIAAVPATGRAVLDLAQGPGT